MIGGYIFPFMVALIGMQVHFGLIRVRFYKTPIYDLYFGLQILILNHFSGTLSHYLGFATGQQYVIGDYMPLSRHATDIKGYGYHLYDKVDPLVNYHKIYGEYFHGTWPFQFSDDRLFKTGDKGEYGKAHIGLKGLIGNFCLRVGDFVHILTGTSGKLANIYGFRFFVGILLLFGGIYNLNSMTQQHVITVQSEFKNFSEMIYLDKLFSLLMLKGRFYFNAISKRRW